MIKKIEYVNRVMLIMNEAELVDSAGTALLGADTTQVDRMIEGSFVDAWRQCAHVMPRGWLYNKTFKDTPVVADKPSGTGYVLLPDDFYLLTSFRMTGWFKSIKEAYEETEKVLSVQSNPVARGSRIRPVGVLSNVETDTGIKRCLRYYSLPAAMSEHSISEAIYVPVVKSLNEFSDEEDLGLNSQMIEPIAYLSAATVFTLFGKTTIAQALQQKAIEMYPGLKSVRGNNITYKQ